jgi:hypothetical protein
MVNKGQLNTSDRKNNLIINLFKLIISNNLDYNVLSCNSVILRTNKGGQLEIASDNNWTTGYHNVSTYLINQSDIYTI